MCNILSDASLVKRQNMLLDSKGSLEVHRCTANVFRVTWRPNEGRFDPCETRTWSVVGPNKSGSRFSAAGTPRADVLSECFGGGIDKAEGSCTPGLCVEDASQDDATAPPRLRWGLNTDGVTCVTLHEDLHYRQEDEDGTSGLGRAIVHRFVRRETDGFYGLGETSGALNKRGRRCRLRPTDCMGYDAKCSDPLYKHLPFLIVHRQDIGQFYGIFYDTTHECVFDLGCEANNYYGPYVTFATRSSSLDYYLIAGPTLADVVQTFSTSVVGTVPRQPAWTFGYLGSSMGYTDDPRGAEALLLFLQDCRRHRVACTGFHLSSGYSMGDDGLRYVFEWNLRRFPDPKALCAAFHEAGVRLIANIKPAMLTSHPAFETASTAGLFVSDKHRSPQPELTSFWGGQGAHLNFLSDRTRLYWGQRVEQDLLECGVDTTWNDNNEYTEVCGWCTTVDTEGDEPPSRIPARGVRCVQTLLMTGTSYEAQCRHAAKSSKSTPSDVFVIARSGMYGSHRIASTWTGDNYTSWETLEYNLPMGLGMALSGWSNVGHDIGGFAGPVPSAELMYRWCQQGLFHPRFTIHSWKPGHAENSPWMFDHEDPQHTLRLAALTQFRLRMIPWLVQLNALASDEGVPMIAPLLYYHPHVAAYTNRHDVYYFGPNVVVVPPLRSGIEAWDVENFPPGEWWSIDGSKTMVLTEPSTIRVSSRRAPMCDGTFSWELLPPVFVRAGSIIPLLPTHALPSQNGGSVGLPDGDVSAMLRAVELHCYPSRIDPNVDWATCRSVSPTVREALGMLHLPLNGQRNAAFTVINARKADDE